MKLPSLKATPCAWEYLGHTGQPPPSHKAQGLGVPPHPILFAHTCEPLEMKAKEAMK